jgi:hypothetical protein
VDSRTKTSTLEADHYTELAKQVKHQIDLGRASSSLVQANFALASSTLAYGAYVDPEPASKAVAAIAAWGAKKGGDALGQLVIETSQNQAHSILAQGLKNSGLSNAELRNISPEQLRDRVTSLKIGNKTLGEILKDDPGSLALLQANALDIAGDIGTEALARSIGTQADVKSIQETLAKTTAAIQDLKKNAEQRFEKVEGRISALEQTTRTSNEKLDALKKEVAGQSKAIQTLAQISFSGWSTTQKLQALESNLLPNLTQRQKDALEASLRSELSREKAISEIKTAAQDLGNLAAIAGNLGLSKDLVTGLHSAQTVATGIAQFATGDVLGSMASLTSLAGIGTPDAAAERHAAMMRYLEQQFAIVNEKLNKIIDLQVQTIKAILDLTSQEQQFHKQMLDHLDQIENEVLTNQELLRTLMLHEWADCYALVRGGTLNGVVNEIPSKSVLVGVIGDSQTPNYVGRCYMTMVKFLDVHAKSADWAGEIISARYFPKAEISADPELLKEWREYERQRIAAYGRSRDFVLLALANAGKTPAVYLARLAQPVTRADDSRLLAEVLAKQDLKQKLESFKCSQTEILSPGLKDLICYKTPEVGGPPSEDRWQSVLGSALLGPLSTEVLDIGITISRLVDFSVRTHDDFDFVSPSDVEHFAEPTSRSHLLKALRQHKGIELLNRLRPLTEANLLQQSITYGDFTAELVEDALYDKDTRSLIKDPVILAQPTKRAALEAMRANPVLARNVVLIAMRHAISDAMGGREKADAQLYGQSLYAMGLGDFADSGGCDGNPFARKGLMNMFPNWQFEYRASSDQKKDPKYKDCPSEFVSNNAGFGQDPPSRGSGIAVSVSDFYVLVPSAIALSSGDFELADSLRFALMNRDRLSQEIIDREMGSIVRENAKAESEAMKSSIAFALINEGWGWQTRQKTAIVPDSTSKTDMH